MKILLFCENKYAVDILFPLQEEADREGGHEVLWFVDKRKIPDFPLREKVAWTNSMQECFDFSPEAVYVPGNIVPYYLPGVKIEIFHGYAAEKKDHWVIRRYFDAYFTQGPYFTEHFKRLSKKYGDFEVLETGWTRQDWIFRHKNDFEAERQELLRKYGKKEIVIYAPTFSPKLTSLPTIKQALVRLTEQRDILLLIKLHPLTRQEWVDEYRQLAEEHDNILFVSDFGVTKWMLMSDVLISDTSSTIYEFLLLRKPVITLNAISKDIYWKNITDAADLCAAFDEVHHDEQLRKDMLWVAENYDPHLDGQCAKRMIEGAADYIRRHGVPTHRSLNLWRKYTSTKTFGRIDTSRRR